jgi:hypothetical protein
MRRINDWKPNLFFLYLAASRIKKLWFAFYTSPFYAQ